jgi:hypothetical protein
VDYCSLVAWVLVGVTGSTAVTTPRGGGWVYGRKQSFDGAALVHGLVALSGLFQEQLEVEDLAGVNGPVPDQVNQLGQEPVDRGRTAVQVHVREEQLRAGQLD